MSLKAFHIVFVVASTLLAIGFGWWGVAEYSRSGDGGTLALGVGALACVPVLIVYGAWFLRKLKKESFL